MKKIVLLLLITATLFVGCVSASPDDSETMSSTETVTRSETKTEERSETRIETKTETDAETKTETETETEAAPIGDGETLSSFVDFLDKNGFVFSLSQGDFMDLIESFTVNGKNLEIKDGTHFDYDLVYGYGGGFDGSGEGFTLYNDYYTYEGVTHIINRAFFSVQLDGVEYPVGVRIGDGLESVLEKLGIDDFRGTFLPDEDNGFKHIIIRNSGLSLEYLDVKASQVYSQYGESCQLIFEEKSVTKNADGSSRNYTRRVILYFSGEDLNFSGISAGNYIEY